MGTIFLFPRKPILLVLQQLTTAFTTSCARSISLSNSLDIVWYPTETATEKRIKLFYEDKVGAKSTSVGSFNIHFNLSKTLTDDAKDLLKQWTTDADQEFTTTDAMKTIVSVSKNAFKNKLTLMNQYQQHCINCMYRFM